MSKTFRITHFGASDHGEIQAVSPSDYAETEVRHLEEKELHLLTVAERIINQGEICQKFEDAETEEQALDWLFDYVGAPWARSLIGTTARRNKAIAEGEGCEHCVDGDGECLFPDYGVAPHVHDFSETGSFLGSTRLLPRENWPANFREDPQAPGCGTYTHCPMCGKARTCPTTKTT